VAKGNGIVVSSPQRGVWHDIIVSGTPKPGTVMQIKAATEPVGGIFTWEAYDQSWDAQPGLIAVLDYDGLQGSINTTAYVSGARARVYCPVAGEQLNVIIEDVAGTSATSDYAIADRLEVNDGTGKLQDAATGTTRNYSVPFICLETITDTTADYLAWCMYTGK
jgi:hypothetical protein